MRGEISYDLVMEDDMDFVEGSYRIGSEEWRIFIVSKSSVEKLEWHLSVWESGVSGVVVKIPRAISLNFEYVEQELARILGCEDWFRVNGPDSMILR